jgi:hypothetical protein
MFIGRVRTSLRALNSVVSRIVGVAMVVWSATFVSVLKTISHSDYPIATSGKALGHLFETLSKGAQLDLVIETEEVHRALAATADIMAMNGQDKTITSCSVPEWCGSMNTWLSYGTMGTVREFEEERQDSSCIKMRMLATWESQEGMTSGVSERDHPSRRAMCPSGQRWHHRSDAILP